MRYSLLLLLYFVPLLLLKAQKVGQVSAELQEIHRRISNLPCDSALIVSNRAMNIFLADKVGYYLTDNESQSFYKNTIAMNTGDGTFSLNHNMYEPKGLDESVKSFWLIGVKANVLNAFNSAFSGSAFNNELGMTLKQSWIGKTKTTLNNCSEKLISDASREIILKQIEQEIKQKEDDFENSLANIKRPNLSDSDLKMIKDSLKNEFYRVLKYDFSKKFATMQYQDLFKTIRFKSITRGWTNINFYLPIIRQRYVVAESFNQNFEARHNYPAELSIVHTRFLMKKKFRLYSIFRAGIYANNATKSNDLEYIGYDRYKNLGGKDSLYLLQHDLKNAFVGNYKNFFTPNASIQFVYFPTDSHIGVSLKLEKNFGNFNALNGQLGIPVVLIHPAGVPAADFEFQIRYFDMTHSVFPQRTFAENISINFSVGVPFSKIVF